MVGPDPTIHLLYKMDPRLKAEDDSKPAFAKGYGRLASAGFFIALPSYIRSAR